MSTAQHSGPKAPLATTFPSLQLHSHQCWLTQSQGSGLEGCLAEPASPQHPGHFWAGTGAGPLHPGFLRGYSWQKPQAQICLIYLEEKQRKPTLPTAPNKNTLLYPLWQVPARPTHCSSPQTVYQPSAGPRSRQRQPEFPGNPSQDPGVSPHLDQEPQVSAAGEVTAAFPQPCCIPKSIGLLSPQFSHHCSVI